MNDGGQIKNYIENNTLKNLIRKEKFVPNFEFSGCRVEV